MKAPPWLSLVSADCGRHPSTARCRMDRQKSRGLLWPGAAASPREALRPRRGQEMSGVASGVSARSFVLDDRVDASGEIDAPRLAGDADGGQRVVRDAGEPCRKILAVSIQGFARHVLRHVVLVSGCLLGVVSACKALV